MLKEGELQTCLPLSDTRGRISALSPFRLLFECQYHSRKRDVARDSLDSSFWRFPSDSYSNRLISSFLVVEKDNFPVQFWQYILGKVANGWPILLEVFGTLQTPNKFQFGKRRKKKGFQWQVEVFQDPTWRIWQRRESWAESEDQTGSGRGERRKTLLQYFPQGKPHNLM